MLRKPRTAYAAILGFMMRVKNENELVELLEFGVEDFDREHLGTDSYGTIRSFE